jgi:hypothetical protein
MPKQKSYTFTAQIYKTGINFAVDVPANISSALSVVRGYIRIKGTVNRFSFTKSLVPVKGGPYRLFVNIQTLKGAKIKVGESAEFVIEQDNSDPEQEFPIPDLLMIQLKRKDLLNTFNALSFYRRKEILRYLANVKTKETLEKNIKKVIGQLEKK